MNLSWIVDIREIEKTIIIVGSSGLEPLPKGPDLQSGCRIRTTFATHIHFLCNPLCSVNHLIVPRDGIEPPPFVCKTNTLPLRHRGKWMNYFFIVEFVNLKTTLYREMVTLHSKVGYEPSLVLDLSVVLVDIDSSSILGFPPNPLR